ncbi:MAG: sortase [Acidobacteriota bacterium]
MSGSTFLLSGAVAVGRVSWTVVRSRLTQFLLGAAWKRTLLSSREAKPWPWAAATVVARLTIGRSRDSIFVLEGSGATERLAPAHRRGTALPGDSGNCVIDSHQERASALPFASLQRLATGDRIRIERRDGRAFLYVVERTTVVGRHEDWMTRARGSAILTVITDSTARAMPGGSGERFVITARLLGAASRSAASRTFPRRRTLPTS